MRSSPLLLRALRWKPGNKLCTPLILVLRWKWALSLMGKSHLKSRIQNVNDLNHAFKSPRTPGRGLSQWVGRCVKVTPGALGDPQLDLSRRKREITSHLDHMSSSSDASFFPFSLFALSSRVSAQWSGTLAEVPSSAASCG